MRFMGEDFASVTALRGKYPAFAGDDALKAIRAGCDTVLEVERFCYRAKNRAYLVARANARASKHSARAQLGPIKTDKRAAAKRGGLVTKAKGMAR